MTGIPWVGLGAILAGLGLLFSGLAALKLAGRSRETSGGADTSGPGAGGGVGVPDVDSVEPGEEPPARTETVNVATGPQGPPGAAGPPGEFSCVTGFSPGYLVINAPGGQVKTYTCLEDE